MTEILTIDAVATLLRCDEKTVSERLVSGDLPGAKFGRSWIVPAVALFQRINDLATEEAAERRRSSMPNLPPPDAGQANRRGRKRFSPPA